MPTNPNAAAYMAGRKKYGRPQGMLWSNNSGILSEGIYIPDGYEINSTTANATSGDFLILSDDNRSPIDFVTTRIEKRERMINGRMRSYHIADKVQINVSWDLLPSRSHYTNPEFNVATGKSPYYGNNSLEYTTDGGAGGVEMLDWYRNHKGSFWVFLSYDNYKNFDEMQNIDNPYAHLHQYSEIMEMYFSNFQYTVVKRGSDNFDMWNISVTLEEV